MMPNTTFENYQYFINHWMNWLNFRNSYIEFNLKANMEYLLPYLESFPRGCSD
jgi:hypothetical protein